MNSNVNTPTNPHEGGLLIWIVATVIVLASSGLSPLLTGHAPGTGNPLDAGYSLFVLYGIATIAIVCTFLLLLQRPSLLKRGFWLFAAALLPLASTLWSPDYYETFRLTTLYYAALFSALAIAFYFSPAAILQIGTRVAIIILLSSLAVMILFPTYGFHTAASELQSVSTTEGAQWGVEQTVWAGAWRGIYSHKNGFGEALGMCLILLIMAPRMSVPIRFGLLSIAVVCTIYSRSASPIAFTLCAFIVAAFIIPQCFSRTGTITLRCLGIFLLFGIFVSVLVGQSDLTFTLLDRDPTLSGRTTVWLFVLDHLEQPLFFGLGYITGYQEIIFPAVFQTFGAEFHHIHNGFLDTYLGLGLIGLSLFLFLALSGLRGAIGFAKSSNPELKDLGRVAGVMILFYLFSSWTDVILSRGTNPIFPMSFLLIATIIVHHRRSIRRPRIRMAGVTRVSVN